jgi:hypothetical protein
MELPELAGRGARGLESWRGRQRLDLLSAILSEMPEPTTVDHGLGKVGTGLGRAVGIGATAGLTADVAGLNPRDAAIIFGTTTAVAATREFAGQLRRPVSSESEGAIRNEIANWLVNLHGSLRGPGDWLDSRIDRLETSMTQFVHDAQKLKDDRLEAALVGVRAELRIQRDFGPSGRSAVLLKAVDMAFARTTVPDPESLSRLKKAVRSSDVNWTDYLASGGHSRALRIDQYESFQVEIHPASYSLLWSTEHTARSVVEHLHSLLPAHPSRVITRQPEGISNIANETHSDNRSIHDMPSDATFVRLEYADRVLTWEPHAYAEPSGLNYAEPAELGFLAEQVDWRYIAQLIRKTATPRIAGSVDELIAYTAALVSDFPAGTLFPRDGSD